MKGSKSRNILRLLLRLCVCIGATKAVTTGYPQERHDTIPSSYALGTDTPVTYLLYLTDDSTEPDGLTTELISAENDLEDAMKGEASWKWEYPWSWSKTVQTIFACVGITGNLLVVLAVTRRKSSHATDILIGALAVADLLSSIFLIPLPRATMMPDNFLGEAYCKIIHTYFYRWTCLVASIYTLAVMSCERMVAVVFPLHVHQIFSKRNASILIVVIWLISPLACFLFLFLEVRSGVCDLSEMSLNPVGRYILTMFVRMVIPATIMVLTQVITAVSLHRQWKHFRGALASHAVTRKSFHHKARDRVVKMMFIVVSVYILSWSPVQITFLMVVLGYIPRSTSGYIREIGTLVTYINTMANPFIYAARYPKFRAAVKEIFVGVGEKDTPLFHDEHQSPMSVTYNSNK